MRKIPHPVNVKSKASPAEFAKQERKPIYLVLDNIRSIYNVGSMFRTADSCLVKKIYLCGITGAPPRKEIDKTALATVNFVSWEYRKDVSEVLQELRKEGVQIIALEQCYESVDYREAAYSFPVALVLGHEVEGVSDEALKLCDMAISIPMLGMANSLNVANSAAIALHNLLSNF
ncbi:MAG: RNA methyltransferase [Candidatus Gracilibacteria bacterium]|nr:RNA methyltransferase [Candidatus Gracilibacteria bacterium]